MMNSKQRRYSANLHRRYREDLQQLRHRVRELLTEDMLDQLGREMAHYIAGYRDAHDAGPTRRELCDLPDRFAPAPDGRPSPLHRTWRATALDPLFAGTRRRGWLTYTRQARSLDRGPRAGRMDQTSHSR